MILGVGNGVTSLATRNVILHTSKQFVRKTPVQSYRGYRNTVR